MAGRGCLSLQQVPVLVARDRAGQTANVRLEIGHTANVVRALQPLLAQDVILSTDGRSTLAAVARQLRVAHRRVNVSAGARVVHRVFHIQNVNAFDSRLKGW